MNDKDFSSNNYHKFKTIRKLTDTEFYGITDYLKKKYGLKIPIEKKMMLESRLQKRLHELQLPSFDHYLDFVFKAGGKSEYINFVDLVTTHKTYFFREDYQFQFVQNLLSSFVPPQTIKVWSAGCSTGEEVYSLGMVLNEHRKRNPRVDYRITGTDISVPSLEKAANATFIAKDLSYIPKELSGKYLKDHQANGHSYVKFDNPDVMKRIKLGVLNLNNPAYNLPDQFDMIFCRNVIIYFDLPTQYQVLQKLLTKLKPGGYLFLGHSETAIGVDLPLKSIKPTIYQKSS